MKISSLYIHIPFCLRKCNYCDFTSYPVNENLDFRQSYVDMLLTELALIDPTPDFSQLETIYFGGGTPSLLTADEIIKIITNFPKAKEVTLEANPETLDEIILEGFLDAGINRLSLGIQSFSQQQLDKMGRGHSPKQAEDMVKAGQKAGFSNISIDLIYGLPDQSLEEWENDLEQALALGTQHISLYCLDVENDTPWGQLAKSGQMQTASNDLAADMFEMAIAKLINAGFEHYEISNFAQPGFVSQHNIAYWQRKNYLGLGVAAASCVLNHRMYNCQNLSDYQNMLQQGKLPYMDEECLTIDQVIAEALFLGLRLLEGIDFAEFTNQYGISPLKRYGKAIKRLEKSGLLIVDEQGMRLSQRGVLLGNQAFLAFV